MEISAKVLAQFLNGTVEGNPDVTVNRPSKIEEGGAGSISFLGNTKYEQYAYTTTASILLVSKDFAAKSPVAATLIRVDDVYSSVALLMAKFGEQAAQAQLPSGISELASVHSGVKLGKNVSIGPFSVVEEGAELGDNVSLHAQVFVGKNAKIGANSTLFPGVKVLFDCEIGQYCTFHPGVIIGGDGFGFAPQADGTYQKIPQLGKVIIEDNVEIGANSCVDRASIGATILRKGVKIDNLCQIAHNVEIGENTVIAAISGVAGSTKIGKNCMIGGQVGIAGHLRIADGTKVQALSGVGSHIKTPDQAIGGYPAFAYNEFIRAHMVFKNLPELQQKLLMLEKELEELKGNKD
jgi:UDP-3-O-[3-hydroxymyristoyl] glucosamine N-acyltransferase